MKADIYLPGLISNVSKH